MNSWLFATKQLVQQKEPQALLHTLAFFVTKNLNAQSSIILNLSSDGRRFVSHAQDKSWLVDDFDVPFSHVLKENKVRTFSYSDLVYWQKNAEFKALVDVISRDESLIIIPFQKTSNAGPALMVLVGISNNQSITDELFTYLDVFISQWQLMSDIKKINFDKEILSEALNDVKVKQSQQQKLAVLSSSLIGESSVMKALKQKLIIASESPLSVMIHGDTGTGKEVVARAIHEFSQHSSGKYVAINCSAIPENLLESELFGYVKGAFSGADSSHDGLIKQASGGTLFLDEIGDMPLNLQAKLLRVLEEKSFRPVGGKIEEAANFRLISATHINIKKQVQEKKFRQDLYYRLIQSPIYLTPLRERLEDVKDLSDFFIHQYNEKNERFISPIISESVAYLQSLRFPGNVRELKNIIDLACSQTKDFNTITAECLLGIVDELEIFSNDEMDVFSFDQVTDLRQYMDEIEAKIIKDRLIRCSGNKTKTAESLGLPLRTLTYKCQKIEEL